MASYNASRSYGFPGTTKHQANAELAAVVQIETVSALEHVDQIAALPGADALFVGPADLSAALGVENPSDPRYVSALESIVEACRGHGRTAGILATDAEQARTYARLGFSLITVGSDALTLAKGWRRIFQPEGP